MGDDKDKHDDGEDKSVLDKIEEATGGTHQGAPLAGFEQEGNFEGIQDARQAESS